MCAERWTPSGGINANLHDYVYNIIYLLKRTIYVVMCFQSFDWEDCSSSTKNEVSLLYWTPSDPGFGLYSYLPSGAGKLQICCCIFVVWTALLSHAITYYIITNICHLYILQWLVKRAIETREEMGDYIRQYAISQFDKTHSTPEVSILLYHNILHNIPHHAIPHHTTPCHAMPCHAIPHHVIISNQTIADHTTPHHTHTTPYQTTPYHATPHHAVPYYATKPYHITSCHTKPYHTKPHHTTSCHTTSCHAVPYHATKPYHTISHHATPYQNKTTPLHATPYHATLPNHTTPCHATPHHAMPPY